MRFTIIFLLFTLTTAWAQESKDFEMPFKYLSYQVDKKFYRFIRSDKKKVTISESCGLPDDKKYDRCDAIDALNNAHTKKLKEIDLKGGKNTGDILCKKYLDGRVVFGETKMKNPISFCLFKDGSMVTTGSISYYSRKK